MFFCDFKKENCSQGSVFRGSEEFVYELLCCVHKLREFGLCRSCYEILSLSHFKRTILSCRGFFFIDSVFRSVGLKKIWNFAMTEII